MSGARRARWALAALVVLVCGLATAHALLAPDAGFALFQACSACHA